MAGCRRCSQAPSIDQTALRHSIYVKEDIPTRVDTIAIMDRSRKEFQHDSLSTTLSHLLLTNTALRHSTYVKEDMPARVEPQEKRNI